MSRRREKRSLKLTLEFEAKEIEAKRRSLELKEKELERKEKAFESRKRSRDEPETSLFAENDRDEDPLYDPPDHMPLLYARIKKVLELPMKVEVTWLETKQKSPIPIACGEFKYGERTIKSFLTFSHLMVDHTGKKKSIITINPRKGETWALFRRKEYQLALLSWTLLLSLGITWRLLTLLRKRRA